jgi:hypothetical protein
MRHFLLSFALYKDVENQILWYLTPSVSVQDPAQITEGIVPWRLNRGNFYVAGASWGKAHARRLWLLFEDFWSNKKCIYERRNADTKRFFAEFQRDPEKYAKILAERTLRREIRRILNTDKPYSSPMGLLEPKPEPVDEEPTPPEFMYRCKGVSDEGFA